MAEVRTLHYSTIVDLMEQINHRLLSNGKGLLLQATVNHKNEVLDCEIVPLEIALKRGFEPAKMLPKGKGK